MIVLRRWPTCSGFATFGLRVVDHVRLRLRRRLDAELRVGGDRPARLASGMSGVKRRLMKPGPATVGGSSMSFAGNLAMIAFATSGGFWPSALASAIAMFAW